MKRVVKKLIDLGKTISTMESCTGGYVANEITCIEGVSEVFQFGAVTYSNDFKIKLGVDAEVIDTYSVYSIETAREMGKKIAKFANSNYGIGITGKLNRFDENNPQGKDNLVFVAIYDRDADEFYEIEIEVNRSTRRENKEMVYDTIMEKLLEVLG